MPGYLVCIASCFAMSCLPAINMVQVIEGSPSAASPSVSNEQLSHSDKQFQVLSM